MQQKNVDEVIAEVDTEEAPEVIPEVSVKPPKTFDEQIDILTQRGLYVADRQEAILSLSSINYYRLRGYYNKLTQNDSDNFIPGTSLSQIITFHQFDSKLRKILLGLLLDIEITARARIAYVLAHQWGPLGYENKDKYTGCDPTNLDKLLESIHEDIRRSNERFIVTYNEKYKGQFPIWVTVEVMSFGDLSKLYGLLPPDIRQDIANYYGKIDQTLLVNWLLAASVLRNVCAHNSRLYDRTFAIRVTIENNLQKHLQESLNNGFTVYNNTLFAYLLALRRISTQGSWNTLYDEINRLFDEYYGQIEIIKLGFPFQWKKLLCKK